MVKLQYEVNVIQLGVYAEGRYFDTLKEAKAWGTKTARRVRKGTKTVPVNASIHVAKYYVWDDGTWSYEGYEQAFILQKVNTRYTWRLM